MKNKFKIIVSILITLSMFASQGAPVYAADDPTSDPCIEKMKPIINQKSTEFKEFLKSHFQNKSTNTSLTDLAIKRFEKYKTDITSELAKQKPLAGVDLYVTSETQSRCAAIVSEEFELMEKLFRSYFVQAAKVKTTSAYMNKLKAINKKMDTLLKAVMQMYGKWLALKDRISCITKSCI